MPEKSFSGRIRILITFTLVGVGACIGINEPRAEPSAIQVVRGENQRVLVGTETPLPIVFRVVDASGNPVAGIDVSFFDAWYDSIPKGAPPPFIPIPPVAGIPAPPFASSFPTPAHAVTDASGEVQTRVRLNNGNSIDGYLLGARLGIVDPLDTRLPTVAAYARIASHPDVPAFLTPIGDTTARNMLAFASDSLVITVAAFDRHGNAIFDPSILTVSSSDSAVAIPRLLPFPSRETVVRFSAGGLADIRWKSGSMESRVPVRALSPDLMRLIPPPAPNVCFLAVAAGDLHALPCAGTIFRLSAGAWSELPVSTGPFSGIAAVRGTPSGALFVAGRSGSVAKIWWSDGATWFVQDVPDARSIAVANGQRPVAAGMTFQALSLVRLEPDNVWRPFAGPTLPADSVAANVSVALAAGGDILLSVGLAVAPLPDTRASLWRLRAGTSNWTRMPLPVIATERPVEQLTIANGDDGNRIRGFLTVRRFVPGSGTTPSTFATHQQRLVVIDGDAASFATAANELPPGSSTFAVDPSGNPVVLDRFDALRSRLWLESPAGRASVDLPASRRYDFPLAAGADVVWLLTSSFTGPGSQIVRVTR